MCKTSWGPCFNSEHEFLETDLKVCILNLEECEEGDCERKLTSCLLDVAFRDRQIEVLMASMPKPPLDPPVNPVEISRASIADMIDQIHRPCLRYLDDNMYWMPTVDEYKALVMYLAVYSYPYVAEKFDCNKFTKALAALTSLQPGWEGTPCFDVQYQHPVQGFHSEMLAVLMDDVPKFYVVEGQSEVNGVSFREAEWQFSGAMKPWLIKQ